MQLEGYTKALEIINSIINNRGIAEVKMEGDKLVVVEVGRSVRYSEAIKKDA